MHDIIPSQRHFLHAFRREETTRSTALRPSLKRVRPLLRTLCLCSWFGNGVALETRQGHCLHGKRPLSLFSVCLLLGFLYLGASAFNATAAVIGLDLHPLLGAAAGTGNNSQSFTGGLKLLLDTILLVGFIAGTVMIISGLVESRNGDDIGIKHMLKGALIGGSSAFMYGAFHIFGTDINFGFVLLQ